MANIRVSSICPIYNGMPVTFKAPCDCTAVEGLTVSYESTGYTFTFKDAHGNTLTGLGNLFSQGALVKAILDTENGFAYLQNADTNGYLENRMARSVRVSLPVSGWKSQKQTVTVAGVLADESAQLIYPVPTLASQTAYMDASIRCTAQGENSLTFTADATPSADITVYVVIQGVKA